MFMSSKKQSAQQKTIHLTLINMGGENTFINFVGYFVIFSQSYMKNKIGILENDIYIFSPSIVNSVIIVHT